MSFLKFKLLKESLIHNHFCEIEREIGDPTDYQREERWWRHIKNFAEGFIG
jgi:hypothetical protein